MNSILIDIGGTYIKGAILHAKRRRILDLKRISLPKFVKNKNLNLQCDKIFVANLGFGKIIKKFIKCKKKAGIIFKFSYSDINIEFRLQMQPHEF